MCWFFKSHKDNPNRNRPLIFLHGIMGSYSPEILGARGNWGFGIASLVYKPFINNLKRLGYIPGKNLFICYYNWMKPNSDSARDFLMPKIKEALDCNPHSNKVDILCHSMGGIVARAYIQSPYYNNDVDKLIFMATPNLGALNAYYPWSGGTLAPGNGFFDLASTAALKGFLWILRKSTGEATDVEVLRNHISSVKDLLPCEGLGNYLYYYSREGKLLDKWQKHYVPIYSMEAKNYFLDNLNNGYLAENLSGVSIYNIIGEGHQTNRFFEIEKCDNLMDKWTDGKPINEVKTDKGDGTVLSSSVKALGGKSYYTKGNHTGVLREGIDSIAEALGIQYKETDTLRLQEFIDFKEYLSIIVKGKFILKLTSPERENLMYNNINSMLQTNMKDTLVIPLLHDMTWILAHNPGEGEHRLEIDNRTQDQGRVFFDSFYSEGQELSTDGASMLGSNVYTITVGGNRGVSASRLV